MCLFHNIKACAESRRGAAFILVLLIMAILLVLGLAILGMSASNAWMSSADRDYQSAFFVAESGRDTEVAHIQEVAVQMSGDYTDADEFYTALDTYFSENYPLTVDEFDSQFGNTPQSVVTIDNVGERSAGETDYTYTLVSCGEVGGVKRQVASDLQFSWVETQSDAFDVDVALFSVQDIMLTGSSRIIGPVGTNATGTGDVSFEWSTTISGDLYINQEADPYDLIDTPCEGTFDNIGGDVLPMPEERSYELPPYPEVPSLPARSDITLADDYNNITIDQDGYYHAITTNSYTMNIDVGDGVCRLVVDNFTINGDGHVNIIGAGLLELYVTDTFSLKGSSTFNAGGDRDNVMLYYGGDATFSVDGSTAFVGSVYVKDADIDIVGSGGVTGHIVSGGTSIDITGNAAAYVRVIYAPNAYVHLSGSGHVTGSVIANRCFLEGDTYINFNADAGDGGIPIEGFGNDGEVNIVATRPVEQDF